MTKITLEISSCKECPFLKEGMDYSTDGWDRGNDWFCTAKNDKQIAGFVEWHEVKKIEIPEWCPAKTNTTD